MEMIEERVNELEDRSVKIMGPSPLLWLLFILSGSQKEMRKATEKK